MMLCPRALLDVAFCKTILDCNEERVVELVEEGLLVAFNLACSTNSARRELRILGASLTYFSALERPLPCNPEEVAEDIFAPGVAVTTASLQRSLNCSRYLVLDLIRSGALRLERGSKLKRGRGGAGRLDRASAITFLKSRILQ